MLSKLLPLVVGIGLLFAAAPAAHADAVPKLDWRPCDPGFECATAKVPRDYSRPHGATIELALIRRPASDRENRIGSLFINPRGPGFSGVDFVVQASPFALATFGRLYDIVGFDPRGVGASSPPIRDCHEPEGDRFIVPDTLDVHALLRDARDQLRRCEAGSGGLLPHLTTANVARDLSCPSRARPRSAPAPRSRPGGARCARARRTGSARASRAPAGPRCSAASARRSAAARPS